MDLPEIFREG